ncbi:MAG: hypothetical protein N3E45_02495 [Oscillatoriaceae bacterium SKW80]|nr:hypothetical protein [Oscillatoriaceae bacterium SKYG93]MCX8119693.1 hypothetical protein [Oscillatoriaceae bacterium SKW80]MDW8452430.1 hypothetical protein [Oscillatoriaceae cyanobacterium SKYGB_i_bin93]HIK27596.1 hypothetical protein [Oscillatoriaceae cyanobacterium M7585_C2015_266]
MAVKPSHYEALLAEYSDSRSAIALLKQYRPYLEMIPSMRRPEESVIAIPLPIVRVREGISQAGSGGSPIQAGETVCLPCDVAILMCDPEWKVKMGVEILIYIHRPQEDFSDLLRRWRQTQVWLDKGYEWLMPMRYRHILSEEGENIYPLFVVFPETPERIKRGLKAAGLPFAVQTWEPTEEIEESESLSSGSAPA